MDEATTPYEKLKICYLITRSDSIGGAQLHTLELARYFHNLGHSTHIVCGGTGPFVNLVRESGIECTALENLVREIHPIKDVRAWRELKQTIKGIGPSLIHAHSSKAGILGRRIGKKLSLPTVFTAHGWSFATGIPPIRRMAYRYLEWWAAKLPGTIITVSDHDRNFARALGVVPETRMVTVRYGIPDNSTLSQLPTSRAEAPKLIMVARFEQQKDQATLIEALNHLTELPWNMQFVGDGPLQRKCIDRVQLLGLQSRIEFLGFRQDVPALLERSDLFLLITNWEGLPISILEAMRSGLPVVASDVDGIREEVIDGITGLLVPRGAVASLTGCLRSLLADRDRLSQFGRNGRQRYEECFRFSRMGEEIDRVYRDAIANFQR